MGAQPNFRPCVLRDHETTKYRLIACFRQRRSQNGQCRDAVPSINVGHYDALERFYDFCGLPAGIGPRLWFHM